jgi:WD40 repeat protein
MSEDVIRSVAEIVTPYEAGAHVVACGFLGEEAVFATGEGEIVFASGRKVAAHPDAGILEAVCDGEKIYTCGDDGRVAATDAEGVIETLVEVKNKWIDHVALGPDGALAWSSGKTAFVRTKKGERSLEVASTVGGLAFAPKGFRLAVAHYNGVSLWFPNLDAKPDFLEWKGSHLGVVWPQDGKFLVTTMQEPAMHGWRLADNKHMRMSGYPSRVRSMSFSHDGKLLATSGAESVILWPFGTKDGPMGKEPGMVAPAREGSRVSCVACHPDKEAVAVGYTDGMVMMVRISDAAEILIRGPEGGEVTALAWHKNGVSLAYGTDEGKAGVLNL